MTETKRCPSCGSNVHDIEAPSDDDRLYFERYPTERVRYRSAYPNEHPFVCDKGKMPGSFALVRVDQAAPGVRYRTALFVYDAGPIPGVRS